MTGTFQRGRLTLDFSALEGGTFHGTPINLYPNLKFEHFFGSGTTAENAMRIGFLSGTAATAGGTTYDLRDAVNPFIATAGNKWGCTSVKGLLFVHRGDHEAVPMTGNITFGPLGAATPFTSFFNDASDGLVVPVGMEFALCNPAANGWALEANFHNIICKSSTADSIPFWIWLFGDY